MQHQDIKNLGCYQLPDYSRKKERNNLKNITLLIKTNKDLNTIHYQSCQRNSSVGICSNFPVVSSHNCRRRNCNQLLSLNLI